MNEPDPACLEGEELQQGTPAPNTLGPGEQLGFLEILHASTNPLEHPPVPPVVYRVVYDHYIRNKRIRIPALYSRLRRSTKLQPREIMIALNHLLKTKFIKDNSPLIKDAVLDNKKRKDIFRHVSETPGIHFNMLKSLVGAGTKIMEHHVVVLRDFGLIEEQFIDGKRCFYAIPVEESARRLLHYLTSDKVRGIIVLLLEREDRPPSIQEISEVLGSGYTTINYHIKKLELSQVIHAVGDAIPKTYRLSRDAVAMLAKYRPVVGL